ncbi:hypothetical protein ACP3W9_06355 [Vibrio anguillarum]
MLFSTFQFLITTVLAVVCARAIGLSEGDIPVLAIVIPALWILPQGGVAGVLLLAAMTAYGFTLSYQPIALSVSVWVLLPLLTVAFSKRSSMGVILVSTLIVLTLQVGIIVTQSAGKLGGTGWLTVIQTLSVIVVWWSVAHWKPSNKHRWALGLLLPLWMADFSYAVLVALSITGIMASMESLTQSKPVAVNWNGLLCWTLPTVGFASLVVSPTSDVPNPVFVVWICLLATAWMTDYLLKSTEENTE